MKTLGKARLLWHRMEHYGRIMYDVHEHLDYFLLFSLKGLHPHHLHHHPHPLVLPRRRLLLLEHFPMDLVPNEYHNYLVLLVEFLLKVFDWHSNLVYAFFHRHFSAKTNRQP